MADNVVPFERRPKQRRTPDRLPDHHQALHASTRRAQAGARELAVEQGADSRRKHLTAAARQRNEKLIATGKIVPARITMALDLGGHEGPEVDIACGAEEPAVDLWECGVEVPTDEQLRLLAELTGFPLAYFYRPVEPGPLLGGDGRMWICSTDGCRSPEPDWVDERGVLHYGGQPPRTPPASWQAPLFTSPELSDH